MADEVERGKRWIEKRIRELEKELNVHVEAIEWGNPTWDMSKDEVIGNLVQASDTVYPLLVTVDGKERPIKFREEELEDLGTPEVQMSVEQRLRKLLEPDPLPEKEKIGYRPSS